MSANQNATERAWLILILTKKTATDRTALGLYMFSSIH